MLADKSEKEKREQRRTRAGWMIAAGLLALLAKSADTGFVGLLVGLGLASLPVPLYLYLALWLDRFEQEPPRLLGWSFFWGATVANFIAIFLNTAGIVIFGSVVGKAGAEFFGSVISAPLVEETAKGVMVYLIYRLCRDEFDNVVDGVVYASMVALGFAMAENAGYYGTALRDGGIERMHLTFFIRGVMSPFAHPLFTSMTGIGLGLARQSTNRKIRRAAPLAGLAAAIMLHALWNGVEGTAYIALYFLVMVPIFFGVLLLVARSLRRESELIKLCLEFEVACGNLSGAECADLVTIPARRRSLWRSLRKGGLPAWREARHRQRAASELAFYRDRVSRGIVPPDENLEKALRERLRSEETATPTPV